MTDAPEAPAWLHRVHELGSSDRLRGVWPSPEPGARESAVLILFGPTDGAMAGLESLDEQGGGVDVVLTQRADAMRTHAGQVSFPGGGVEHDDADAVAGPAPLDDTAEPVHSSRIRSQPRNPAWPSLVWKTSGVGCPVSRQNARTARTPPTPIRISCWMRWFWSPP